MGKYLIIILGLLNSFCFSQGVRFSTLSKYEKRWVFFHPIAAVKIKAKYSLILSEYQQVKKLNVLDSFENGGKLDAFRHTYAMAIFVQYVGAKKILKLGIAHEKGNKNDFIKRKLEEGELADSISCEMDLKNNALGIEIGRRLKKQKLTTQEIQKVILQEIKNGNAVYIKRDERGRYVTCDNKVIDLLKWKGIWCIPKCLIPTSN